MGAVLSPALLLAVRINGKGREVLYLAKGDSVKLGCPYVLEPEDNGPQGLGIEWIQITPERTSPENVVSVTGPGSCRPTGRAGMDRTESRQDRNGLAGQGRSRQSRQGLAGQDRTRQGLGSTSPSPTSSPGSPRLHQPCPVSPLSPHQFLSYHDHHVDYGSGSGLQDRVAFVQKDPSQYDASIRLADLQVSDTGTYQCRVKKNTVAVHEVIVTVQGEPPPRCPPSPRCPRWLCR